jgi:hypothetical protein
MTEMDWRSELGTKHLPKELVAPLSRADSTNGDWAGRATALDIGAIVTATRARILEHSKLGPPALGPKGKHLTAVTRIYSYFFVIHGKAEQLLYSVALKRIMEERGYSCEEPTLPPENHAVWEVNYEVSDDELYELARKKLGYDPRDTPAVDPDRNRTIIINFSHDSTLGRGRVLVCFGTAQ